MGNTCCQVTVDTSNFKEYCSIHVSKEYQPFMAQLEKQEINLSGQENSKTKFIILGNWAQGAPKTGEGIIYAPEKLYYEGPIVEGEASGVGKIIWPNKTIFMGVIRGAKAQGEGELYIEENKTELKGLWHNGYPKLNHTFELKIDSSKKGTITFGQRKGINVAPEQYFKQQFIEVEIEFESGRTYQGQLKKRKGGFRIEGKGTLKEPDGSYYQGDFVGGRMHGKGKYFWAKTGHWYQGEYKSNFRDGYGKYFFNSQHFQEGQWNGGTLVTIPPEEPIQIPNEGGV